MKSLKNYIMEGLGVIKESFDIPFDIIYPDWENGTDREYQEQTKGKFLIKNGAGTKKVLKAFTDMAARITPGEEGLYAISVTVGGVEVLAWIPENELWASGQMTGGQIAKLLKQNAESAGDQAQEWFDDQNGDDPDDPMWEGPDGADPGEVVRICLEQL